MMWYSVFNCTRQTLVASEVEETLTGWDRMKGLIGRSAQDFRAGQGLWIRPSEWIHTIGMSFPIDVIYLDAACKVTRIYHELRPFRIAALSWKTKSVLELPAGSLSDSQTRVGDLLMICPADEERGGLCAREAL